MMKRFMVVANYEGDNFEEMFDTFSDARKVFNKLVDEEHKVVILYRFFTEDRNEAGTPMMVYSELEPDEGDSLVVRA